MNTAAKQIKAIVERIQKLEEEIKTLNDDKRDVYAEAKANGFDVKALKAVVSYLRKDPNEAAEHDALFETYLHAAQGKSETGTDNAIARARAREEKSSTVSIAAASPSVAERPEQPAPASSSDKLRQDLKASLAPADAGDLPDFLDRRGEAVRS